MKKILLLNPPLNEKERSGALAAATGRSVPYGLISLAAVIRAAGYDVSFLDSANFHYSQEETIEKVLALNPDYLGITTVTMSVNRTSELCAALKKKNSNIKIIVGGAHLSSAPEETMRIFPSFDIGVIGEGEDTIIELLSELGRQGNLGSVKGIIYRKDDELVTTARRNVIKDLDSLPLPAWDLVPDMVDVYRPSAPSYLRLPAATIVTSRGCFGSCIFCNSKLIHGGLRCFSADYVLNMIRHLVDVYGVKDISIYDDNFVFFKDRVVKICETILREKIDLTWSCYSRVDQGDLDLFKLMKRAGCWQISYGIESGSQRILDLIKKNVTLEQIEKTVVNTKRAGIRTRGFFIIGHFAETTESIAQTLDFMKKIPLDDFHFTTFTPLPGTKAYDIADQYGKMDRTWERMNLQNPVFIPHGLTEQDLERYSKKAYRDFYFRFKIIFAYLVIFFKHPRNAQRLINAAKALVLRVFSPKHDDARRGDISVIDNDRNIAASWDDAHRYSPAPRHRRRLMMKVISKLDFTECLDVGCAQPFFLADLLRHKKISLAGCDISDKVIEENKRRFPGIDFFVADISKPMTARRRYGLVTCSEVLEHLDDWRSALSNISALSEKWLLITVPCGKMHPIDARIGHTHHFTDQELISEASKLGFTAVRSFKWGFPFHTAYKYAINGIFRDRLYTTFAQTNYGFGKRLVSSLIYWLFFINDMFRGGAQLVVLFKRDDNVL